MSNRFTHELEVIRLMLPNYGYRDLNWLWQLQPPVLFPNHNIIVFPNFYPEGGISHVGTCLSVSGQFFEDIKQRLPDAYHEGRLYRVKGNDEQYFWQNAQQEPGSIYFGSKHFYLALTNTRILPDSQELSGSKASELLAMSNAYIVDGAFGLLERFADSKYSVQSIYAPKYRFEHGDKDEFFPPCKPNGDFETRILGYHSNKIFSFGIQYSTPHLENLKYYFFVTTPKNTKGYWLWDRTLDYADEWIAPGVTDAVKMLRYACERTSIGDDISCYGSSHIVQ